MAFNDTSVKYTCTALAGTNKSGKLQADEDGYFTVVVGALDVNNSAGAFYPLGPAKALFEESSSFMRRVKEGNCKGETGHPKPLPGQSKIDYIQRIMSIEETKVCCHFRTFYLDSERVKDTNGRKVTAIIAEVKPAGPMGPSLKEALENKHENVCFSIRSLTNDVRQPTGTIHKNIKTIVTFDWVTEPGISVAKKYNSPALESMGLEMHVDSLEEVEVTKENIDSIEKRSSLVGASMEHCLVDTDSIRKDLKWDRDVENNKPASFSW